MQNTPELQDFVIKATKGEEKGQQRLIQSTIGQIDQVLTELRNHNPMLEVCGYELVN